MGKIVRGYWDCQYCGAKGVSGDKRECSSCGHPRDESVTFYMKEVEYLSDEEAAKVSKNADWYCPYCNTLNSDKDITCKGCGASKEESEKSYFDLQNEKNKPKEEFVPIKNTPKSKFSLWPFIIIGALILIAFLFFRTKTKEAVVDDFSWSREIQIEKYTEISESDWSLPQGAELQYTREEEHPTEKEIIGYQEVEVTKYRNEIVDYEKKYKDLGNGNFEEYEEPIYGDVPYTELVEEPIYRPVVKTKYYYTVWRWVVDGKVESSGNDQNPYWPEVTLKENEREGIKTGKYYIDVTIKDKSKQYEVSNESVWSVLKKGEEVIVKTSAGNSSLYDKNDNFLSNLY